MRRGYADTEAGQIHYRELGEGKPLLLLHKTPSSSIMFSRVMPLLAAAGYRCIAPDNPGYGSSDRPAAPPSEMAFFAGAARGVLDRLGVERADVVGFYTGASIAMELARLEPERVDRLVLAGIVVFTTPEERRAFEDMIGGIGHMHRSMELDVDGRFLEAYPLAWFRDFLRGDGEQYLLETIAYLQCAQTYWWAYEAVVDAASNARPAEVTRPTLCLAPRDGLPLVTEGTRRAAPLIPGARYAEIPGTTEVCMEQPQVFADAVLEFLGTAVGSTA